MIGRLFLAAALSILGGAAEAQLWPNPPYSQNGLTAAGSATTQVIISFPPPSALGSLTKNGNAPGAMSGEGAALANTAPTVTMPTPGILSNLRFSWPAGASGGNTEVITLFQNGSASSMTCTITGGATACADLTHSLTVAAGDYFQAVFVGTGTSSSFPSFSMNFVPTTPNNAVELLGSTGWNSTTEQQQFINTYQGPTGTGSGVTFLVGEAATINNLYVTMASGGPGGTASYAFADRLNGADGSLTCTITGTATACNDTTHTVTLASGNTLSVSATPTGTPTAGVPTGIGFIFNPTTAGNFEFSNVSLSSDSTTVVNYHPLGGLNSGVATESQVQSITNSMHVVSFIITVNTAPGSGTSRTFTLNDNGTPTSGTCTISNTSKTCTFTGSVAIASGDLVDISDTPTGTPSGTSTIQIVTIATK